MPDISIGTLTAFALLLQRFFTPVTALGDEWQTVQGALSGAERIFEVLTLPADDQPRPPPQGQFRDGLVFEDVVFGYVPGTPILHAVSLHVASGEHVALVGRTGAGKTSIVHLLAGLYEPWQGTVRISGRNPRTLLDQEKRSAFGIVPQASQLFHGTVLENLTLNDQGIAESAAQEAATISGADSFIRALPDGYQTVLRGRGRGAGVQLSAGQEQLLALTRALVSRPAVLLFDEATSFLDGASEAALRAALRSTVLKRGAAMLTVAHRLSTAREAHRVVVLDHGRIVEDGVPADLIARGGRFASLLELEAAGWDWRAAT
jgi:ATP-binding cassette subfamily B protein